MKFAGPAKMLPTTLTTLLITLASTASGHRLDEYLQNTIVSVEKNRVHAQMTLTPGVAVFPLLASIIDTDGDRKISDAEQRGYAARVLRDLTVTIDGERIAPRIVALQFPSMDEMNAGSGAIQLDFEADLPGGGRKRKFGINNRHQNRISAYQVNCLVSGDRQIRILGQHRNYSQSVYEMEFEDAGSQTGSRIAAGLSNNLLGLTTMGLVLLARMAFLWRKARGHSHSLG